MSSHLGHAPGGRRPHVGTRTPSVMPPAGPPQRLAGAHGPGERAHPPANRPVPSVALARHTTTDPREEKATAPRSAAPPVEEEDAMGPTADDVGHPPVIEESGPGWSADPPARGDDQPPETPPCLPSGGDGTTVGDGGGGGGSGGYQTMADAARRAARRLRCGGRIVDAVHGGFSLPVALFDVVDTPEFQRLRDIKQLGLACLVYPEARHSRFEHSLGTCHLAGLWMGHLCEQQRAMAARLARLRAKTDRRGRPTGSAADRTAAKVRSLEARVARIDDDDVFLVRVAALCHDLGHGPFSHCFESLVNERLGPAGRRWCHEDVSCVLLRRINDRVRLLAEGEVARVEAMIRGIVAEPGRAFLYRVVNNARTGVDADKFDYLARDGRHVGASLACDFGAVMAASRIERGEMCFDRRAYHALLGLFRNRLHLHRMVVAHPVTRAAELMAGDALRAAEPVLGILAAIERGDSDHFVACTDALLGEIRRRVLAEPALADAAAIVERIDRRDLYRRVGCVRVAAAADLDPRAADRVRDSLAEAMRDRGTLGLARLATHALDFGLGHANPLWRVPFYEFEWGRACAGPDGAVPDAPRESVVGVFAVDRPSVAAVLDAALAWHDSCGRFEGHSFVVDPEWRTPS